ncbi:MULTISPECIES: hypothetical protein [Staphylococcus]|uniref:hypothetical protein n=1 Tax=Staphylococcus TaxID=1279 RepID=UPI00066E43E6|nr:MULTISPECIES: hypothetical protein [Staphylococcus]MBC2955371.1 hypothetical protein [Staphylococcus hominis]MCI2879101.1 hypothetical protein [Staphylococcus hominis]MDS3899872.1 hypothetical protein [Staphylococcus hominis]MDS3899935.1 hypothetical protein [Staphylococcus hominis]OFO41751.1 hypothetical protein HMPREF3046_01950 [Staphylococcus sp. HMSC070D05]
MGINSNCISGLGIAIDGVTYDNPNDLINYLNRINNRHTNLTSEQWRTILVLAFENLAIGFNEERNDN